MPVLDAAPLSRRSFLAAAGAFLTLLIGRRRAWSLLSPEPYDVRGFGAQGDGRTLDTDAINRAIAAAADAGGGTVDFPAGRYLCFSLRLRSRVRLRFAPGAVVVAAEPDFSGTAPRYDAPEPQPENVRPYQDFGHNHWRNSLLWGENLEDVSLVGPGELRGRGLQTGDGAAEEQPGAGNKVLALKRCRGVVLRDFKIRAAGHFGILATGVDDLTIDNLLIDTGRDGIDIDSCRDVRIRGCTVNTPFDDAIVLKSSFSLGEKRATERVTISDCAVTASYETGSVLDGTYRPVVLGAAGGWPARVGRIKIGTETVGDVRGVALSNCVFEGCHGLAVISEDGGAVEDVVVTNIVMRGLVGPPIFVRLGGRLRGPAPVTPGAVRRLRFENIDAVSASSENGSILAGIPGHPVEDVVVSGLRVRHDGPGQARTGEIPEQIAAYPEPEMFGVTPAHGFYLRHARRIELRDVVVEPGAPEPRPLVWMDDVRDARFDDVRSTDPSCAAIQGVRTEAITIRPDSAASARTP